MARIFKAKCTSRGKTTNSSVYIMDSFAERANEETVVWGWCQALLLGKI